MNIRVKLSGVQDVKKLFADLADELPAQRKAVKEAMKEAAEPMATDARAKAPRDQGDLAESIVVTDKVIASQKGDVLQTGREAVQVFVGPSYSKFDAHYAPHAHLVEFGTGPRYTKDGKFTGQTPAQPFMRPAYDGGKQDFIQRFGAYLVVTVQEAARRIGRKRARKGRK